MEAQKGLKVFGQDSVWVATDIWLSVCFSKRLVAHSVLLLYLWEKVEKFGCWKRRHCSWHSVLFHGVEVVRSIDDTSSFSGLSSDSLLFFSFSPLSPLESPSSFVCLFLPLDKIQWGQCEYRNQGNVLHWLLCLLTWGYNIQHALLIDEAIHWGPWSAWNNRLTSLGIIL